MAPRKDSPAIKDAKVLVVGAGGIGCELLKTLALTGFQYIDIIDMGFIEHGDLNRQIYFQESYVGYSKAGVARRSVLKFQPHISITSHQTDVKGPRYDVNFFKQFNIVLIAIDNLDVRRHVNRLCLAANVPLIESGTAGFLGQVTVHVKGLTECYECQPKPAPKTYPVSTINSTPSEEVLLPKLFGDKSQVNDLNVHSGDGASSSEQAEDVLYHRKDEDIEQYGRRIYDHVFGHNIEVALSQEETWKNRDKPKPICSTDVLPNDVSLPNRHVGNNGATSDPLSLSKIELLGLRKPEKVLSLMENSRDFLEATKLFVMTFRK